jgi:hypothetical protein
MVFRFIGALSPDGFHWPRTLTDQVCLQSFEHSNLKVWVYQRTSLLALNKHHSPTVL